MGYSRKKVVALLQSWIGKNERDGSFKKIIDIYNSYPDLPRGIKMEYNWEWCACTWSAAAISLGYTKIMPIELSCGYLIEKAKNMGIWKESDKYIPKPGDAILYDWDDKGSGDDHGWPDHIGIVERVSEEAGYFTVIEGNYNESVKRRTVSINGRYIRGFITPKYDKEDIEPPKKEAGKPLKTVALEVISGVWGRGEKRKESLEKAGYDYKKVQKKVNDILNETKPTNKKEVTANCRAKYKSKTLSGRFKVIKDCYCRNDAGTNKKALCKVPKGTSVQCYGYYNTHDHDTVWPYVTFELNEVTYTGFIKLTLLSR